MPVIPNGQTSAWQQSGMPEASQRSSRWLSEATPPENMKGHLRPHRGRSHGCSAKEHDERGDGSLPGCATDALIRGLFSGLARQELPWLFGRILVTPMQGRQGLRLGHGFFHLKNSQPEADQGSRIGINHKQRKQNQGLKGFGAGRDAEPIRCRLRNSMRSTPTRVRSASQSEGRPGNQNPRLISHCVKQYSFSRICSGRREEALTNSRALSLPTSHPLRPPRTVSK